MKGTLLQLVFATAIFALGVWSGKSSNTQAAGKGECRVFELRTYTAGDGKLESLHSRFRQHTTKLFEKHGMTNIGYWQPTDAPLAQNTLSYLLAYPNRDAAKNAWDAFRNDPDWKKVLQESETNGKLAAKVESVFLEPTDYSPLK